MKYGSLFDPFTGKEKITLKEKKEFLQSPAYCDMIRKMVVGMTADYRMTVYLLSPDDTALAFTDGSRVMINTLNSLFADESIEKITEFCLALTVHESLHPLYSCFQCIKDAAIKRADENDNIVKVRKTIFNILEDARIERIGAYKFPGVAYAITALNEHLYNVPYDMSAASDISVIMKLLLDYVSVNKIRAKPAEEIKRIWEQIKPLALKAKYSDTCGGCYYYTKKIIRLVKKLIPEQEEVQQPLQKPQNTQGNAIDVNANTHQEMSEAGGTQGMQSAAGASGGNGGGQDSNQTGALTRALSNSYNEHMNDKAADAKDRKTAAEIRANAMDGYNITVQTGGFQNKADYSIRAARLTPVINSLKKGLKNVINYNVDEVSRYLHTGHIDPKSLSRIPSGAICAKRIEKSDESELNITVLVDLSGSMSGILLENAIDSCIVLQEVCLSLKIPITVLGFVSSNGTQIKHFSDRNFKGRYSHMGVVAMKASGGTPLTEAMCYLPKIIKKQTEEDKLVIVITDGYPNGSMEDCAAAARMLSKYAKVYGLAIAENLENLTSVFGANCIQIDSIEKLPKELCRIIEKNILKG